MYIALGQTTLSTLPSGSGSASTTTTGGATSLPGAEGSGIAPATGGAPIALMTNWTYHPAVVMGMQSNMAVFNNPKGDFYAWRVLADTILATLVADPTQPASYQDAVWALSSAYGYYFMPGSGRLEVTVQQGAAAAAQEFLSNDAYAMSLYAAYAAAQVQISGGTVTGGVKPRTTGIYQRGGLTQIKTVTPGTTPPPGTAPPPGTTPPPAAPSSSTPWLLLGGVAVVGVAAYFLI